VHIRIKIDLALLHTFCLSLYACLIAMFMADEKQLHTEVEE